MAAPRKPGAFFQPLPLGPVPADSSGDQTIALGRASSTETARALTVSTALATAITRASETDTARALTPSLALAASVGRASESDEARALTVAATLAVAIARATETDVSRELTAALALAIGVGRASESDEARGLVLPQTVGIGRASETDEARGVAVSQPGEESTAAQPAPVSGGIVSGGAGLKRVRGRESRILEDVWRELDEEISGSAPAPEVVPDDVSEPATDEDRRLATKSIGQVRFPSQESVGNAEPSMPDGLGWVDAELYKSKLRELEGAQDEEDAIAVLLMAA